MIFFDFNIQKYYEDCKYLSAFINYSRKSLKISKKQMQKDNLISHATFRRAEVTNFVGHPELLNKLAEYFRIPVEFDIDLINEINEEFNIFYTCLYFNDLEKMEYYYKRIEAKKDLCSNSILLSVFHFSRLIYYVSSPKRVEIEAIAESIEIIKLFQDDLLDIFAFLFDEYLYCYYSLIHDKENALKLSKKVYLEAFKYPRLVPMVLYQMSVNYYFINDYANSIFYSLEALPKLENDLNYNRAISSHLNLAICFERLDNTVRSKEILNRIFLYMTSNYIPRVDYLAKLTLANCCVTDENYLEAVEIFKELEANKNPKGENSLMILFCYYKSHNKNSFKDLASDLYEELINHNFYKGYYDLVILLEAMLKKNKKIIYDKFLIAEKSFPNYSDSKIVDLIYLEIKERNILPIT